MKKTVTGNQDGTRDQGSGTGKDESRVTSPGSLVPSPQSRIPSPGFTYSWHKDVYDKAIRQMVEGSGKKYAAFIDEDGPVETGWLEWFEQTHPDLYKKYVDTVARITKLWGDQDMSPQGKEEFKAAVKMEVEATGWAVDRFIEQRKLAAA